MSEVPPSKHVSVWHVDDDGDGFGDPNRTVFATMAGEGRTDVAGDCDDQRADVHPNAYDVPLDGVDQDCTGTDATCENRATWPGDLPFTGLVEPQDVHDVCREFAHVAGALVVEGTELESLDLFTCLCDVGGLILTDNRRLTDAASVEAWVMSGPEPTLTVERNHVLQELRAPSVTSPAARVSIRDNDQLVRITGLDGLHQAASLSLGGSTLVELPELPTLQTAGVVELEDAPLLERAPILRHLRAVDVLTIGPAERMAHLRDLESLDDVGQLHLDDLSIATIDELARVSHISEVRLTRLDLVHIDGLRGQPLRSVVLWELPYLQSIEGLRGLTSLQSLEIRFTTLHELGGLADLATVEERLVLHELAVPDLRGLEALTSVGDVLAIERMGALTSLSGLERLRSAGSIGVRLNDHLVDVAALRGLTELTSGIELQGNRSLSDDAVQALFNTLRANGVTP